MPTLPSRTGTKSFFFPVIVSWILSIRFSPTARSRRANAARSGSTAPPARPPTMTALPTMIPSHASSTARTVSAVTPLPTSTGTPGTAARTEATRVSAAGEPVASPVTMSASARPRSTVSLAMPPRIGLTERLRVLDEDVGEDHEPGRHVADGPHRPERASLHDALVRDRGPDVHVHADERPADRGRDGDRRLRVAPEDVHADRQPHPVGDARRDGRKPGDRAPAGEAAGERRVTEVLDDDRVEPGALERRSVVERPAHDVRHRPRPPGASGQRKDVDHADETLRLAEEVPL